jgi:dimeric dUTPase (all-alpha-NTP-PPase superfamily)
MQRPSQIIHHVLFPRFNAGTFTQSLHSSFTPQLAHQANDISIRQHSSRANLTDQFGHSVFINLNASSKLGVVEA